MDLHLRLLAVGDDVCPCTRVGAEASDEVVGTLHRELLPLDLACVLEYLRSRSQRFVRHELTLVGGFGLAALDEADGLDDQLGSLHH